MNEEAQPSRWDDALHAAALLAVDPFGLAGICLRARHGPVRDRWLAAFRHDLAPDTPFQRVGANISQGRLQGGLDLTGTLALGQPVVEAGVLAACDGGVLVLGMAERVPAATAAQLGAAIDEGLVRLEREGFSRIVPTRFVLVMLDEGDGGDEHAPAALCDRVAFEVDLDGIGMRETSDARFSHDEIRSARARLRQVRVADAQVEALCGAAAALGIGSMRTPLLALRTARAAAALAGRDEAGDEDVALAARLVLAARALALPASEESDPSDKREAESTAEKDESEDKGEASSASLEDVVLDAARAAMPPDLLGQLRLGAPSMRARSIGSGAPRATATRGRPVGARQGDPRKQRLDVLETLRAAAPWQRLRKAVPRANSASGKRERRLETRRDDFRVTRYRQRTQTTAIFAVDASGSSALHRLAEAKGAVQMLLADCYVRRDNVAVLAFRGRTAEVLLPVTRSLVRAKRSLASLPGGGGTPLACGIDAAAALADLLRRRGQTPIIVLFTDGRANVARDGVGGRDQAERDALHAASAVRTSGIAALLVDISVKPQEGARRLALAMGARYLPLPQASSPAIAAAIRDAVA